MNKFLISESEKQRILEMHKTAVEKNVIYEAPTATPTPKVVANSTIPVKSTFNCRYNKVVTVATVTGSYTKLSTGAFKPSDNISVTVDGKRVVKLKLDTIKLVYFFDSEDSSPESVEGMGMTILKGKKPSTAITEVISQINKGAGTQTKLSNSVINAFNKLPSGVFLYAKTPMPVALKSFISTLPYAELRRTLDPETNAIVNTELWLGNSRYGYNKNANGDLRTTRGSANLLTPFSNNQAMKYAIEDYDMTNEKMKKILNQLWETLEPLLA
jgi:hypothetical protein